MGVDLLPARLNAAFGPERLDGVEPAQRFDQGGVALRAGLVGAFGEQVQAVLQHITADHDQHESQYHRQQQPG